MFRKLLTFLLAVKEEGLTGLGEMAHLLRGFLVLTQRIGVWFSAPTWVVHNQR